MSEIKEEIILLNDTNKQNTNKRLRVSKQRYNNKISQSFDRIIMRKLGANNKTKKQVINVLTEDEIQKLKSTKEDYAVLCKECLSLDRNLKRMHDGKRYIEAMLSKMDLFDDMQEEPEYIKLSKELGELDLEINRLRIVKKSLNKQKKDLQYIIDDLELQSDISDEI